MTSEMSDMESKLKEFHNSLHRALSILVRPADESSKGELNDILELNVKNAMKELQLDTYEEMDCFRGINCGVNANSSVRWKFVCVTLYVLLSMKATAQVLSSVSQQKTVRTCLQFVVSMGLLPSLLPGVGVALAARCSAAPCIKEEELLLLEKYERLAAVTRGLLVCAENQSLRQLIVAHHLGDLMAALSQLSFVPLKKPVEASGKLGEEFVMTPELWSRLQRERSQFRVHYLSFIWEMYPPLVIRELLVLHGAAGLKRLQTCARSNPPSWLKKSCIILLIHCIMRPKGVSSLVRAICDSDPDTGNDWARIDTVVSLITTVHTADEEKYNRNICVQLVDILQGTDKLSGSVGHLQLMVARHCIEVLYKDKEELVRRHVLDVILQPLLMCCAPPKREEYRDEPERAVPVPEPPNFATAGSFAEGLEAAVREALETVAATCGENSPTRTRKRRQRERGAAFVPEEHLSRCILNMHRLFAEPVSGRSEPPLPTVVCASFAPVLFALYRKIYSSPCHYKSKVENLLSRILCSFEPEVFGDVFRSFVFGDECVYEGLLQMDPHLEFCFADGGAVEVHERDGPAPRPEIEVTAECVFELLANTDRTGEIASGLFLALLHVFFEPVDDDGAGGAGATKCRIKFPVDGDTERSVMAAQLLSALSESEAVREKISTDPNYLVRYVFFILEQDARQLSERTESDDTTDEHLFIVLMILSVVVNSSAGSPLEGALFDSITEPIKMIRDTVTNEELRHLASQIYNKVVTRGVITESTAEPQQTESAPPPTKETPAPTKNSKTAYLEALGATYDPSVAIRGHGLVELTRLLRAGDEEACRNKDDVFMIFKEGLNHEDSYIYLSSVNGLSALAMVSPDTVIGTLVEEFADRGKKRDVVLRLKVGEVLVQVTKMLGDTIPLYKDTLLNAFLGGVKDPDGLVRASSLSNLGTLCSIMKFRVGPVLHEIFLCVKCTVQSDPDVEVRRAAILVLTLLLEGLGEDSISVLQDVMLDLYRELKKVYTRESDDVVKFHVQTACEALGKLTVDFITRPTKLEKRICISGVGK